MKALVYKKKRAPVKFILSEVEKPVPGDNEVLIKVHAVSINAADYRSMQLGIIPKRRIFGADISGTVESAGKNISVFGPGDEIIGELAGCGFGGLAEYVTAPEKVIIKKPAGITFDEAASFPIAASTALQALRNQGNIMKDMDVLLVGSSGGVGTFAIQLAHYFEANITAVCSSRNLEQASDLGAEKVIDYAREYFADNDRKYDIILAINGNYPIRDYRKCLKPDGTYVMVGGSFRQIFKSLIFGRLLSTGKRNMKSVTAKADRKDLEFLASLLEQKKIRAVIEKTYPFEQAAEAIEYVSKGHSSGKVVVRMVQA